MPAGHTVLGIDPGSRRLGVAVSDPAGLVALPLEVVSREGGQDLARIVELVRERKVTEIVVGLPKLLDGTEGTAAGEARAFASDLRKIVDLPVNFVDERLTTVQANRSLDEGEVPSRRRRKVVDKVAAAVLLQSYLDSVHPL